MSVEKFKEFKERSSFRAEISAVFVMFLFLLGFYFIPKIEYKPKNNEKHIQVMDAVEIPETEKLEQAAPPERPTVPVMSEDVDVSEDVTIEDFTFDDYDAMDAPPPPPEENTNGGSRVKFIPYDEAPTPLGGSAAILRNTVYPEIAREAQIEGKVVIQAFINEKGIVTDCVVFQGIPNTGLNEAAIDAIKKTRFKPAKQRDRNVGVWIAIPVNFKLKSN
ncbi:MAG: energy transducer TonB [Candidatus Marinimicrobia bacterium]|jgi:protein TonB|nr:energy transducer TonB [Candidatus Neomarinimicrobiota bacterium]